MASATEALSTSPGAAQAATDRRALARDLWPDKSLYAAIMLFVAAFVGILTGAVQMVVDLSYNSAAPALFTEYPSWAALLLSLGALVLAVVALVRRQTLWTLGGALLVFLSLGFLGVNALLALMVAGFVVQARREGEERNPETRRLVASMWPDKALAAALVTLNGAILTVVWGLGIALDFVTYDGWFGNRLVFGFAAFLSGLVGLVAARLLFQQRAPGLGLVAAALQILVVGFWIVGPALAIAALVLVGLALREEEFSEHAVAA